MFALLNFLKSGLYNDATLAGYVITNIVKVMHFRNWLVIGSHFFLRWRSLNINIFPYN